MRLSCLVALSCLVTSPIAARSGLSAAQAARLLDTNGPPGPTWPHFDDDKTIILEGLRRGDPQWLALAGRLRASGDAGFTESIPVAMSHALRSNPAAVLQSLRTDLTAEAICHDIDIEPTAMQVRQFYAETIRAVQAVHAPKLQSKRTACLQQLAMHQTTDKPVPLR